MRHDPSTTSSRLKRLICGCVIPDAMWATPSPRLPGLRPTRRTQPHAAIHHSLSPTHSPAQAHCPLHSKPTAPVTAIPLSNKPTRIHNPQTHSGPYRHNPHPNNLTQSQPRTGAVPPTQSHNPPYKQSHTNTTPHSHRITQSLRDLETHLQLAAIHSSQPDPHTP